MSGNMEVRKTLVSGERVISVYAVKLELCSALPVSCRAGGSGQRIISS